jgi:lipoprotein-anchoring transpeptidase ErfK/SrfK
MRQTAAWILISFSVFFSAASVHAQGVVDQEAVREITQDQRGNVDNVRQVEWQTYTVKSKAALKEFLESVPGQYSLADKIKIVELANRVRINYIKPGKKLAIPKEFNADYRAYSPWPYTYSAGLGMPKLFIIDKRSQTFGAYENGKLAHWGLVSTGRSNNLTPAGRYNFTWKTYYKLSNAAPEGEKWRLYWVFDFYSRIGLHVHQYNLPINKPASHGCVRMARPDAEWNYTWARGWVNNARGGVARNGTPVMVINSNPSGNVAAHWRKSEDGSVESNVNLPGDLYSYSMVERNAKWESGW